MVKTPGLDKNTIFDKYARHVSSQKAKFFLDVQIDFVFGRREGPFVWDIDGNHRLINCHSNGGVYNLGHRNPQIIQTLKDALNSLDIGNHHLVSKQKADLAERLAALSPEGMDYVVFAVGGGEAIDTAVKIARRATNRRGVLSAVGGYHGHTGIALATGDPKYRDPFLSSASEFAQVVFNDIGALKKMLDETIAAVIFETIPATLGMPIPDDRYFAEVKNLCLKNGSLLIMDEVQTGLGRTGCFWGVEHYHTVPDIIVAAKGLGGGIYPVAATIIRKDLETVFHEDPFIHISTTGGADIGCVVAQKAVEISSSAGFLNHVNELARIFSDGLHTLKDNYPHILLEIRQKGLMCGLKTAHKDFGPLLTKTCFDAGLLCIYAGNDTSVLQFLPVLTIDFSLAHEILERLDTALKKAGEFIQLIKNQGAS
jgi:acetylornithine/succinyldiaminopimelate/putrescine aminotransferase